MAEQQKSDSKKLTKVERAEVEREDILNRLKGKILETTRDKVAFLLNDSGEARNSDIDLAWAYWNTFEGDKFEGPFLTKETLRQLTRYSTLTRMRRKIQNDYKLFEANDEVKKRRGILQEGNKEIV
ncbi:hypothetical protein [Runella sp.]|uniref:hypothetical protein n=1 Tax=Runella sp. TaxID=1960881 RepID=UPI003D143CC1